MHFVFIYMKPSALRDKDSTFPGITQLMRASPKHTKLHGHQQNSPNHFGYEHIKQQTI